MIKHDDAEAFLTPLKPDEHGVSTADYDKVVKQPIDLGTIKAKLGADLSLSSAYKSTPAFCKDVNKIFSNVMKLFEPNTEIVEVARRLQNWWMEEWRALAPKLMSMKSNDNQKENEGNVGVNDDTGVSCAFVNNERGEDFQEQIGMPDEENMRHWSHHHSVDTVDDPVFRAAMRGYDSVSFVFGLEVTWSLIQQRQQEEEERAAMLELERLENIEEDNEDEEMSTTDDAIEGSDENDTEVDSAPNTIDVGIDMIKTEDGDQASDKENIPQDIPEDEDSQVSIKKQKVE